MSTPTPSDPSPTEDTATTDRGPGLRERVAGVSPQARVAALVVVALLAGGGAGFAIGHDSGGSSHTPQNLAASFAPPLNGGGGGLAGEQHIQGTLTAKTAGTITVKARTGSTATYAIQATTQIVRNGQASSLSDLQVGDPVLVHVYPSSSGGQMLVEAVIAGTGGSFGPGGFGDRGRGFGGDGGGPNNFAPQSGGAQGGVSIN